MTSPRYQITPNQLLLEGIHRISARFKELTPSLDYPRSHISVVEVYPRIVAWDPWGDRSMATDYQNAGGKWANTDTIGLFWHFGSSSLRARVMDGTGDHWLVLPNMFHNAYMGEQWRDSALKMLDSIAKVTLGPGGLLPLLEEDLRQAKQKASEELDLISALLDKAASVKDPA